MIVALGLPLKVATIILGFIFLTLLGGSISIPTPPIVALLEIFHVDAEANVHPLPVSWYLISLLWMYLCSCMHIMFLLWSIAKAVSSGSWPILFKVLTLNVTNKLTHEPIMRIISKQLEIKIEQFAQVELDSILRKIKNRKAAGLLEILPEVLKTREFDKILLRHCYAVYNQNTIDRWTKRCILSFSKKCGLE